MPAQAPTPWRARKTMNWLAVWALAQAIVYVVRLGDGERWTRRRGDQQPPIG